MSFFDDDFDCANVKENIAPLPSKPVESSRRFSIYSDRSEKTPKPFLIHNESKKSVDEFHYSDDSFASDVEADQYSTKKTTSKYTKDYSVHSRSPSASRRGTKKASAYSNNKTLSRKPSYPDSYYTLPSGGVNKARARAQKSGGARSNYSESWQKRSSPRDKFIQEKLRSAKRVRRMELENEIDNLQRQLDQIMHENRTLKRMHHRQEKELGTLVEQDGALPDILAKHNSEVKSLRRAIKHHQEKYKAQEQQLKSSRNLLSTTRDQLANLKQLADDKKLLERDDLKKELDQVRTMLEDRDNKVSDLQRHVDNLTKTHKRQLGAEVQKRKGIQEELNHRTERLVKLEIKMKEMEKESDVRNIYSNRALGKPPHHLRGGDNMSVASESAVAQPPPNPKTRAAKVKKQYGRVKKENNTAAEVLSSRKIDYANDIFGNSIDDETAEPPVQRRQHEDLSINLDAFNTNQSSDRSFKNQPKPIAEDSPPVNVLGRDTQVISSPSHFITQRAMLEHDQASGYQPTLAPTPPSKKADDSQYWDEFLKGGDVSGATPAKLTNGIQSDNIRQSEAEFRELQRKQRESDEARENAERMARERLAEDERKKKDALAAKIAAETSGNHASRIPVPAEKTTKAAARETVFSAATKAKPLNSGSGARNSASQFPWGNEKSEDAAETPDWLRNGTSESGGKNRKNYTFTKEVENLHHGKPVVKQKQGLQFSDDEEDLDSLLKQNGPNSSKQLDDILGFTSNSNTNNQANFLPNIHNNQNRGPARKEPSSQRRNQAEVEEMLFL